MRGVTSGVFSNLLLSLTVFFSLICSSTPAAHAVVAPAAAYNKNDVIELTRQLVDIPSVSNEEFAIGEFLAGWLKEREWTIEMQEVPRRDDPNAGPPRYNILAYKQRNFRLLINSHMDTVPPFLPLSEDEVNLYGRGTTDAKSQISTQLIAVEELLADHLINDTEVGLLYVVGEEVGGDGMLLANELQLSPEYLLVGEPTKELLATGHKSPLRISLESRGRAAHSGYPELGQSAISPLLTVLSALEEERWPVSPILGPTTLNIGEISGGVAANVVPAFARTDLMVRVTTSIAEVVNKTREIVDQFGNNQVTLLQIVPPYEPVFLDTVPGFPTGYMSYGTDIPRFFGDHRSYLAGVGSITVAHSEDEFVPKSDVVNFVETLKRLILTILNQPKN